MNIKVCGITELKQLTQLEGLGIEFVGLNFYASSSRYMKDSINGDVVKGGDFDIKKVGVFVNAGYDEIMEIRDAYDLDVVQLHGDEPPLLCEQLSEDTEVIKVFRVGEAKLDVDELVKEYDEVCDYYLFDTAAGNGSFGGTGVAFDWKKLSKAKIEKPFFLSGGIGPADPAKIKAFKHPDFYGIDINSQFEKSPGVKDMVSILQFKQALKKK
ncbi:MAG: phosphoribosylanthranilate isomerase [Bacteroidota bacterium]